MSKTKIAGKAAMHLLVLLITYILLAGFFPYMRFHGYTPMLFVAFTVGIAMNEGGFYGGIAGLLSGILTDNAYGNAPLVSVLLLTAAGMFVGYMSEKMITKGIGSFLVVNVAVAFCVAFLMSLGHGAYFMTVLLSSIAQAVYSAVFSIPYFFACRALARGVEPI